MLHVTSFFWLPSNWLRVKSWRGLPEVCVQRQTWSAGDPLGGRFGYVGAQGKSLWKTWWSLNCRKSETESFVLSSQIKDWYSAFRTVLFVCQGSQIFLVNKYLGIQRGFSHLQQNNYMGKQSCVAALVRPVRMMMGWTRAWTCTTLFDKWPEFVS